jgi:ketosteroid isomerase-like protein
MTEDRTRSIVLDYLEARESRDIDRVRSLLAPDVEWHAPPSLRRLLGDVVPWHSTSTSARPVVRGRDDVTFVQGGQLHAGRMLPESITRDVARMLVEGDRAVVHVRMHAHATSGDPITQEICYLYRVTGEHIDLIVEYPDTLKMARLTAPPASTGHRTTADGAGVE